jgi:hypothetical protein
MNITGSKRQKTCLFCRKPLSSANRAREHVVARTLLDKLDILQVELSHSHLQSSHDGWEGLQLTPPETERRFIYDQFLCGRVCGLCNHGWMSDLDGRFAPLLLDLARSKWRIAHLSKGQNRLIAKWAAKTAMVLSETVQPGVGAIPRRHASIFHRGAAFPDSFIVLAARSSDEAQGFRFSFCSTWMVEAAHDSINQPRLGHTGAYKVFMQIKNVMFLVCHYPVHHAEFLLAKRGAFVLASTLSKARRSLILPEELPETFRFAMSVAVRLPTERLARNPPTFATCYCGSGDAFEDCCKLSPSTVQ